MADSWARQAITICGKDLRVEFREKTALSALMLFAVTSLLVVGFAVSGSAMAADVAAALLWVVLFFAAFSGLSHAFVGEEEAGTALPLRLSAAPEAVLAGKWLHNLVVLSLVASVATPLFVAISGVKPEWPGRFVAVVAGGVPALSAAATITGAIVAKARARGVLFGALGFPIVLPLLVMAVVATRHALSGTPGEWSWARDFGGLVSYAVMILAASTILFPIVWETR